MNFLKPFFVIVVLSCASLVLFSYLINNSRSGDSTRFNDVISNLSGKFQKFEVKLNSNFKVIDKNELKFDDMVNTYCKVEVTRNISRFCLRMLQKYDLDKLSVEFELKDANDRIHYHTYWQPDAVKSHHQHVMHLNILSFLATQDRSRTKYIVWTSQSLDVFSKLINDFEKYIKDGVLEFRVLDLKTLCSNGVFLPNINKCLQAGGGNVIMYSDFVRFLVLYTYGGIYVDGDVIFLRDMKPFWYRNFVYRWSFTESFNTAIMGLKKAHGEHVEKFYKTVVDSSHSLVASFYPSSVKDTVAGLSNNNFYHYEDLEVYSSVLFDPGWLCFDVGDTLDLPNTICRFPLFYDHVITRDEFDKNGGKLFDGAFTHHLHLGSCGSCQIREDSYFSHVRNSFKGKLKF